jgi:hypothetical protein
MRRNPIEALHGVAQNYLYRVSLFWHCHQLQERSFFIRGRQMPLCARCTGILLGLAVFPMYVAWGVSWLPDGEKLVFTTESETEGYTIWLTSVFGGAPLKLRSESTFPARSVSPQGSSIAFVGGKDRDIWVMGINGENPKHHCGLKKSRSRRE